MILAASSASGSWQYLLASTRHASASCTCRYYYVKTSVGLLLAAKPGFIDLRKFIVRERRAGTTSTRLFV